MLFQDIANFCCAKVGKIDSYSVTQALAFCKARHKMIYESFNWKAAQIVIFPAVPDQDTVDSIPVPLLSHVTSVSVNGVMLDPVSTSYIFESAAGDYDIPSTQPKFFDEFYSASDQTPSIRFYPPLDSTSGDNLDPGGGFYKVIVLGKQVFNPNAVSVAIPHTENALIAFVLGDMWEYLHQVGKAQAKFTEANQLLKEAQDADTPPALRPRMTAPLTATGNTLGELTDSVCNIIGKFDPDTRVSVKERIRRNYQMIVDAALWPELSQVLTLSVTSTGQVIVPEFIDRVVAVRTNLFQSDIDANRTLAQAPYELGYQDIKTWFGVQPEVFEQVGAAVKFSFLPPVAVATLPAAIEPLKFQLTRTKGEVRERMDVFVKGFAQYQEYYESVDVWADPIGEELAFPNQTLNQYDLPITIAKPISLGTLIIFGANSGQKYGLLLPDERERRRIRLQVLPNTVNAATLMPASNVDVSTLVSVLVLGKTKVSALVDEQDACQIRNCENILINASAADMLYGSDATRAAALKAKADTATLALIDAETKQGAYNPVIVPYAESSPLEMFAF